MTDGEFFQKTEEYLKMAQEHINKDGSRCSVVANIYVQGQTIMLVGGDNYGIQVSKEQIDEQLKK